MEKLKLKHEQLLKALRSLEKTIDTFKKIENKENYFTDVVDCEEEYRIHRDSVIQRFEYTIDMFWKYLKTYLESVHVIIGVKIPREVITQACSLEIITQDEAEKILEMIKDRNRTSHIYVEEIAEQLIFLIPTYYDVLISVVDRIFPK